MRKCIALLVAYVVTSCCNAQQVHSVDSLLNTMFNNQQPGIAIGIVQNGKTIGHICLPVAALNASFIHLR